MTILILVGLGAVVDFYIYRCLAKRCVSRLPSRLHLAGAIIMAVYIIVTVNLPFRSGSDTMLRTIMWLLFGYLTVYVSKMVFIIVDLVASLPRLLHRERIKVLSKAGVILGGITFVAMWWGALVNRFNTDVVEVDVDIPALPQAFDGYRIVQISDLHTGTYGRDTTFLSKLVKEVNALSPDLIVFSGDIVNRQSNELKPFLETLRGLHAPDGVVAVLGNHDYGDYREWKSEAEKTADVDSLVAMQRTMGWNVLMNEHVVLKRGQRDSIAVVGVENVGDPPFKTYGALDKAYNRPSDGVVKVLVSHNPAHWVNDIADNDTMNIALTLAGHTHAMQIEVLGMSPAVFRYKTWGGLYKDKSGKRNLYVNIGAGTVGLPMRLGATPEITVLTLRK